MKYLVPFLCAALCLTGASAIAAGAAPSAPKAHAAESQQEVAYADLDKYVGKRIVVRTTLNTTRSGVLLKHSKTEIDLKLDTGAELSIMADTIKRVTVPIAPPDPLFQDTKPKKPGDSSAKKN